MLKKVAKALDEMAKNEELMEGILQAAMGADELDEGAGGRIGGGEIEQPGPHHLHHDFEEGALGGERLGTIGEDGDEDRQNYDTHGPQQRSARGGSKKHISERQEEEEEEEYSDRH
jgi:hypothetical protein